MEVGRLKMTTDPPEAWSRGKSLQSQIGDLGLVGDLEELAQFDPALPHYLMEFQFGEIMSRPGLDLRTRLLCALATLLANQSEFTIEEVIRGALNAGASKEEIVQVIIQTGCFSGFPKWAIGSRAALKVFRERGLVPPADPEADRAHGVRSPEYDPNIWDKSDLWARGWAKRDEISGADTPTHQDELARFDPLLVHYHMEVRYGAVYCRPELDVKTRELCRMVTFLTSGEIFAAEGAVEGALNVGATRQEIVEAIIQTGTLCGFGRWTVGAKMALRVFDKRGLVAPKDPAGDTS
jgi:4-carboxymuconolactone decarboxylase